MATVTSREAYLPLYVGDFLASTAEWTGEEQGLYLLLLGYQWSIGSLPADANKLCRMIRWDREQFDRCWPQVSEKFSESDGRLQNVRLEQHRTKVREIIQKRSDAGRQGAKSRWQTDSTCHADATDLPMATEMLTKPNQTKPIEPINKKQEGEVATDVAPASPPVATQGPNRKKRGNLSHFVPEDWTVPEADYLWVLQQGYPPDFVRRETERFCDHEFKTPRSDWTRAWRNWITRDPPKGAANGSSYRAA